MDTMEQRRNRIVDFINTRASITFAELKEAFPDVSDMTLRTDLKVLDEEAKIVRVHGGAKAVTAVLGNDDRLSLREVRNIGEKELVVSKALSLIRPDTTIFLDSGSTTTMLARALPDQPMMIFTASLTVAMELSRLEHPDVFVIGGTLNRNWLQLRTRGRERAQTIRGHSHERKHPSDGFVQSGEEQHVYVCGALPGRCCRLRRQHSRVVPRHV